jgi:hypothetical protein
VARIDVAIAFARVAVGRARPSSCRARRPARHSSSPCSSAPRSASAWRVPARRHTAGIQASRRSTSRWACRRTSRMTSLAGRTRPGCSVEPNGRNISDLLSRGSRRMLGTLDEADDAVQEAWIRLSRTDESSVQNLGAWLKTVVSRVCLDCSARGGRAAKSSSARGCRSRLSRSTTRPHLRTRP